MSATDAARGTAITAPGRIYDAAGNFVRDTSRPLGSALNPIPPAPSLGGWDDTDDGKKVVHSPADAWNV